MTDIDQLTMAEHDALDELTRQQLLELSEAELQIEIDRRRLLLGYAQTLLARYERELPGLIADHAAKQDAINAFMPELVPALSRTLQPNELGVSPSDTWWRSEHPKASQAWGTQQALQQDADTFEREQITPRQSWVNHLKSDAGINRKRSLVALAQEVLEQKRTARLAAAAELERPEPPSLQGVVARFLPRKR